MWNQLGLSLAYMVLLCGLLVVGLFIVHLDGFVTVKCTVILVEWYDSGVVWPTLEALCSTKGR